MALFNIKIEKVVIQQDEKKLDEIIRLLKELNNEPVKQSIMDKLNSSISDIKKTV